MSTDSGWKEVALVLPPGLSDEIGGVLVEWGATAIHIESPQLPSPRPASRGESLPATKPGSEGAEHVFAAFEREESDERLLEIVGEVLSAFELEPSAVEARVSLRTDDGWTERWKDFFHAEQVAERLWVTPPWEVDQVPSSARRVIIDPGLAFGTGQHATTRLCLQHLAERSPPPQSLLDVGTGTGVLAISSILLGTQRATGIDIDARAIPAAQQNAARNRVSDAIEFSTLPLVDCPAAEWVVANILAPVLIEQSAHLTEKADHGLLLSGILSAQRAEVEACFEGCGWPPGQVRQLDDWVAIAYERR